MKIVLDNNNETMISEKTEISNKILFLIQVFLEGLH